MAHAMKHNRGALGHMLSHYDRSKENISGNIDWTLTDKNYNLAADQQPRKQLDFIHARCKEVRMQNRKDINVMCSWVVTAPKGLPNDEIRQFFSASYGFLSERYGKENIVSAYVHMDENTPHMHFAFVPVVEDKKRNGFKVSAKEAVDRKDLQTFHKDLDVHMTRVFGRDIGVLNEATKEGNKSIEELKRGTASQRLQNALKRLEDAESELLLVESQKTLLEGQIRALEGRILSLREVDAINVKKTITGTLKGITYEDVLNLKKTASLVESAKNDIRLVEARYKELDQERRRVAKEREDLSRIPLKQQAEMAGLKERVRKAESVIADIQNALGVLPEGVKEQFMQAYQSQKALGRRKKTHDVEQER